jgi:hypothetical protein
VELPGLYIMKNMLYKIMGTPLLVMALSASIVTGCRAKSSQPGEGNGEAAIGQLTQELPIVTTPVATDPTTAGPLVVTARALQSEVKAGRPVELEIEVRNVSKETAILKFSSGQSFDFSATREGEKEPVWTWSMDKMFMAALRSQPFEAGKSETFTAKWENAPEGHYTIQGKITANGGLNAAPFSVVVTP